MSRSGREPGRVHDHVDRDGERLPSAAAGDRDLVAVGTDVVDLERGKLLDVPGLDEAMHGGAELPAGGEPSAASAPRRAVPAFRNAHSSVVPGSSLARVASLMSVFAAECPAPTTRTRFRANRAGPGRARRAERARRGRRGPLRGRGRRR